MDVSNVSVQTMQAVQTAEQPTGITQQAQQQGGQTDFLSLIMQLMGGRGRCEHSPPNDDGNAGCKPCHGFQPVYH